jgi:acetolactate synthase-1/2/3 large subunit
MAIQNLFRYRLPVLLFAGRAPHTLHGELIGSRDSYVHFVQDPFDIASIVRPYVKWEYSLPSGVVVREALARAGAFAHSDPPGPVYMMLPRETLAEEWDEAAMPPYPPSRYGSVQAGGIEPARVNAIADALMQAENPVAFAAYLGRKPQAVAALDRLARTCGIRVSEFSSIDLNIPHDSPCFAGSDPLALLEGADLGLLLDTDVPFVPQSAKRASAMKWVQIDLDPLKADFPMWGFATDIRVQGDSSIILQQVCDAVEGRADDKYRRRVAARIASWENTRTAAAQKRLAAGANKGVSGPLNPAFVMATLSGKISQDDVVLNEAIRNGPVLQEQVKRTKPQSYVGLAGGGLGFSGGMALGLRLARPDRRVVQVIGDGGFHFSSPDSVYAVAQQYQIPIFTVVLDNGGWQAVKSATQRVYPKGIAAETDQFQSRLMSGRQGERRDFSEVAKAFGAHGECVTEPDELAAAIDRCLAALDDGKAAVLHVHVTRL